MCRPTICRRSRAGSRRARHVVGAGVVQLVSRTRDSSTFSWRGIPAGGVAPSSHSAAMLGRRALPSGRRAPENLSTDLCFGTLAYREHDARQRAELTPKIDAAARQEEPIIELAAN